MSGFIRLGELHGEAQEQWVHAKAIGVSIAGSDKIIHRLCLNGA